MVAIVSLAGLDAGRWIALTSIEDKEFEIKGELMSRVSEPPSFKDTAGGTVSGVLRRRSKSQSRREIMPSFFVNSDVDITGANGMVFLFGWGCLNGFFIRRPGLKIRLCALPCYAKP